MGKNTTKQGLQNNYTYAEILALVDSRILDARRACVVPVLLQDQTMAAEQRETLAGLVLDLTEIARRVEELRKAVEAAC